MLPRPASPPHSLRAPRSLRRVGRAPGAVHRLSPLLAVALAVAVAATALSARLLTVTGALAASAVGTAVLAGTGWAGGAALIAFFLPTSLLSRAEPKDRPSIGDPKGHRRDHWQVLANGGPAALAALLTWNQPGLGIWIVTTSLAAAGADTWATSIGAWSRTLPRHLLTWRPVPAGTNGGVTWLGCLGGLAGALVVAAVGSWTARTSLLAPAGALIGFGGMLLDSALGASAQGRFHCSACEQPSEWRVHRCGTPTVRLGGARWLDNDGVNALTTTLAALAGWGSWLWLSPRSP